LDGFRPPSRASTDDFALVAPGQSRTASCAGRFADPRRPPSAPDFDPV